MSLRRTPSAYYLANYDENGVRIERERQCKGCGCWVEAEDLDADGFGPDCQIQDGSSRCS